MSLLEVVSGPSSSGIVPAESCGNPVPLVPGPPGVWLQTLLLKHNCRVRQTAKSHCRLTVLEELGHWKAPSTELLLSVLCVLNCLL